ncbi:VOC family protein [Candidatus Babeliales bacterium]|nr:VOC family protein [Candidatus Babeliales bacterium]
MFKAGKTVLVVDSIEKAVKFYTEKLLFDIKDLRVDKEGEVHLCFAELRKGKCNIFFRLPEVSELAEFSMVRRCPGRSTGIHIQIKRGIERFYERCRKRKLDIVSDLAADGGGNRRFEIKDPFGILLTFSESDSLVAPEPRTDEFCGFELKGSRVEVAKNENEHEDLVKWLRGFGISRRAAKKYIKRWGKRVAAEK